MLRWVLFWLGLGVCAAQAPMKNPLAGDAQAIESGRVTFRIYCGACHGIHGKGGRGPDLTLGAYTHGDRDEDLFRVISEGVPGTEMPAFTATNSEDGVWRLVAYIRSIAQGGGAAPPGDRAAGEKLFWGKGGCGQCHAVGARGGRLGPSLTRVGRQRSAAYLRESVVAPDEDLTPGYATITAATRDGRELRGVQRSFDNFYVQFMDASERVHSFSRAELASVRREFRSLMPGGYGKLFSTSELDNLIAYLSSLRGEEGK